MKTAEWRSIVVWECALKGKFRWALSDVLSDVEAFIRHGCEYVDEIAEYENIARSAL